jgi:hypothetical protein
MQGRVPIVSRLCCSEFFLLTAGKCSRSFFLCRRIRNITKIYIRNTQYFTDSCVCAYIRMGGTYVPANSCTLQPFVEKNIFLHFSFILLNFNTEDNLVSIPLLQYFLIPTMLSFQDHRDQLHTPCLQRRGRLLR